MRPVLPFLFRFTPFIEKNPAIAILRTIFVSFSEI